MNELYDLEADPYEEHNLAGDPGARTVLARLQSELRRLMAETKYDSRSPAGQSGR